jgi:hypothetical protein
MPIGRNDPCPCGSGKKYKKCHGQAASSAAAAVHPDAARANALKAVDAELGERLLRFARMRHGPDWLAAALDVYLDSAGGEVPDFEMQLAIPWMLYVMPPARGTKTLAEEWRTDRATRLPPDTRALLDAYAASWLSVWEVVEVVRGVGARLLDLLTREERFVHDVRSTETLVRLDTVLAFVLTCDGVSFFGGVHGQPLPPREADNVVREARRMCHVRTRPVSIDKLRDPDIQLDLIVLWSNQAATLRMQPPPTLTNTDGDPFVVTTDDFELLVPRERVAQRLESLPGAEEPERDGDDLVVAITKPGNAVNRSWNNTVIGRITLTTRRLRAETNSARRADTLRAALEVHLGQMVRYRLRTEANTADLIEKISASAEVKQTPRDKPPPEIVAAMREFRERHMTAWLDDSIPALKGLTPREAARSAGSRRDLEILLKEFERHEGRMSPEERIDIRRLRVELGLAGSEP